MIPFPLGEAFIVDLSTHLSGDAACGATPSTLFETANLSLLVRLTEQDADTPVVSN